MTNKLDRPHQVLFKQVLSNYEQKEYKKGLKAAETILKKYPTHGETMAMKGLILTNVDKKEEGWDYVRKGLRNDLKSHICWHVYGLLYRADRNYEESMKCYLNALKFDPDNLVVLRDLAVIQSQLRQYAPLIETRKALLLRQPEQSSHHTALAVAYHLNKDYVNAEKVLINYETTFPAKGIEQSMLLLYHNTIISETEPERAYHHLEKNEANILDKLEILERKAKYNGNWEALLDINPDCYRYYDGMPSDDTTYARLQEKYPRSSAARRRPLNWLTGDAFRSAIDKYLRNLLQRGVPSTFVDVKALYKDSTKADIIEEVVLAYLESLSIANGHGPAPTAKLWTLYFLAQHFDHRRVLDRAMSYIDEAIEHTPTLVELHMTKARILKHTGSVRLAAEHMNIARELDLQDRFINTKCTKYYLRADLNGEANQTISLFLNSTLGGGSIGDLQEMQSINFLVEDGLSYLRQQLLGLALKRFDSVKKAIDQWYEDGFDFHQYCFRKGTICAYLDSLKWEDTVHSHHVYRRAVKGAVEAYLQLHQHPELKNGPLEMMQSDADKKKEKKRIQKIRARCAKDATREAEKKQGVEIYRKLDLDPVGDKFVATTSPLVDALKYVLPWLKDDPDSAEAAELACRIYLELGDLDAAVKYCRQSNSIWLQHRLSKLDKLPAPVYDHSPLHGQRAVDFIRIDQGIDQSNVDLNRTSLSDAKIIASLLKSASFDARIKEKWINAD